MTEQKMRKEDAEEFTQSLGQIVGGSWRQIALAKRLGVPQALGLSVDQWVTQRLGGYVKMNVEDRRKAVSELAASGESTRSIADVVGTSKSTVADDLVVQNRTEDDAQSSNSVQNRTPLDAVAALAIADQAHRTQDKKDRQAGVVDAIEQGGGCTVDDLEKLVGAAKFGTVYADPPWMYGNQSTRGATGDHYTGMSVDEICALPVAQIAADSAHLHLWTTNAFIFDAKRVMESWGFEYRSCFIWVKPQIGMGNYWRVSHEFMLLGIRGSAPFADKSLRSWAELRRGQHSAKPEEIRGLIERASAGPRLELFGRRAVDGWTVWGNQIERNLFHQPAEVAA
jgi:N6-adenosine-specific RNA methylase IME4